MAVQAGEGAMKAAFYGGFIAEYHVGIFDKGEGGTANGVAGVPFCTVVYTGGNLGGFVAEGTTETPV